MKSVRLYLTCAATVIALAPVSVAQRYSEWSAPVPLTSLNSASNEGSPTVSKDGRSLYFASNRSGHQDLYVSQWDDGLEDWGPPTNLGDPVNTQLSEFAPNLSRDGHWLFYYSNREGRRTS